MPISTGDYNQRFTGAERWTVESYRRIAALFLIQTKKFKDLLFWPYTVNVQFTRTDTTELKCPTCSAGADEAENNF